MICEHPINYIGSLTINDHPDKNIGKSLSFIMSDEDSSHIGSRFEYETICDNYPYKVSLGADYECDIIHFSSVSDVDMEEPKKSILNVKYDLQVILGMDNREKAIYLNSCQTGLGKYIEGEGMLSLGLAFLLSGANQVVETYWQIPDKQSSEISGIFYNDGGFANPARALRSSKIEYLKSSHQGYDHPYYWAGTIVRGGIGSPKANVGLLILIIFTLISIFVGGFALIRQK